MLTEMPYEPVEMKKNRTFVGKIRNFYDGTTTVWFVGTEYCNAKQKNFRHKYREKSIARDSDILIRWCHHLKE